MNNKQFKPLDPKIVEYLESLYPVYEYNPTITPDEFNRAAIYRAGQRDVVKKLITLLSPADRKERN